MQNEKELRTLFESIDGVFFSIDIPKNKVIQISNACQKIFGYPPEKFYKNVNLFSEVIHPDDQQAISNINSTLTSGNFITMEYRIIRANKEVIWVQSKIKPTLNLRGKVVRVDGMIENIDERKNVELRLESKIKELNLYIYRTTHDLRGPILSALGLVYIAKKETTEQPLTDYLDKIEESNKKLDSILLNLVDVIRSLNESPVTKEKINFKALIKDIIAGFEHSPKRTGKDIKVSIKTKGQFFSDQRLITSIIFNLVQNSINYHNKIRNAYIYIDISCENNTLIIIVKDNGIGIPDNIQTRVFEMFYRGTEDSKGSGLGLYIVKNGVEKLGGKLELKSIYGEGTTFKITLPFQV